MREETANVADGVLVARDWGEAPIADHAEGIYLYDTEGKRYIDGSGASSTVTSIGHGVKEIPEAMYQQGLKLSIPPAHSMVSQPALDLAAFIASAMPGEMRDDCRVWLGTTGTDAVDSALRLARSYFLEKREGTRFMTIARWQSFHGNNIAVAGVHGLTYRRRLYAPMYVNTPHIPPAYCYRCPFEKTYPSCDLLCARQLEKEICQQGPENVAAFIAEPVVGAALGSVPAPEGYFQTVREICTRYGVVMISDEVQTGWGRTGKLWGIDHWATTPDIVVTAKGTSSGYTPISVTAGRNFLWEPMVAKSAPFRAGHTMNYNPVSCAGALANLKYIFDHDLTARAAEVGRHLLDGLKTLLVHKIVGDVRGLGMMTGLEFVADKKTKAPFDPQLRLSRRFERAAMDRGLIIYPGTGSVDGVAGDHVQLAPPLITTKAQVDDIVEILHESVTAVEKDLAVS